MGNSHTCDTNDIESRPTHPVANVEGHLLGALVLSHLHPSVFEFVSLVEDERDQCAEILNGKRRRSHSSLALVDQAFCCEHTATNEARDQST